MSGFPAAAFGTNCFVLAPEAGEECVVVDPGIGVFDRLAELLTENRLRPAAVLLTHGHVDHVHSVTPVCGAHGVAAYIHRDDRRSLADPLELLDRQLVALLEQQFGPQRRWDEPDDVVEVTDEQDLTIAGLTISVIHAPGHTRGSVMFALPGAPAGIAATSTLLSGDVLFAGSVGRTDLPGGDHEAMLISLREKVLTRPDDTLVLTGHGPTTTIGRERASNPFLVDLVRG